MNIENNSKKQSTIALKKAQTHINNIIKMIEEDTYCIDVMHQLLAVNGLIKSASDNLMKNHMDTCFRHGMAANDETKKEELISEILDVIKLSGKAK